MHLGLKLQKEDEESLTSQAPAIFRTILSQNSDFNEQLNIHIYAGCTLLIPGVPL